MSLRKSLADAFIGTIPSIELPAITPVKVTRRTVTENNGRKQETVEESKKYSATGAFVRTFISSLLVRKAIDIYSEPLPETPQSRNEINPSDNPPRDSYYAPPDHYNRIRRQLNQ